MPSACQMDSPCVIVRKHESARNIVKMLNQRYDEYWILDRIIEREEVDIYYFKNIYEEPTQHAIPIT